MKRSTLALGFLVFAASGAAAHGGTDEFVMTPLPFDSGEIQAGQSWDLGIHQTGTFPFHCRYHYGLWGTIELTATATDAPAIVNITPNGFVPSRLLVTPGSVVTFLNADTVTHTVTDDDAHPRPSPPPGSNGPWMLASAFALAATAWLRRTRSRPA